MATTFVTTAVPSCLLYIEYAESTELSLYSVLFTCVLYAVLEALVRLRLLRAPPFQIPTVCWALLAVGIAFLTYHVGYVSTHRRRATDDFYS